MRGVTAIKLRKKVGWTQVNPHVEVNKSKLFNQDGNLNTQYNREDSDKSLILSNVFFD